jgi:hypothetical protein
MQQRACFRERRRLSPLIPKATGGELARVLLHNKSWHVALGKNHNAIREPSERTRVGQLRMPNVREMAPKIRNESVKFCQVRPVFKVVLEDELANSAPIVNATNDANFSSLKKEEDDEESFGK